MQHESSARVQRTTFSEIRTVGTCVSLTQVWAVRNGGKFNDDGAAQPCEPNLCRPVFLRPMRALTGRSAYDLIGLFLWRRCQFEREPLPFAHDAAGVGHL